MLNKLRNILQKLLPQGKRNYRVTIKERVGVKQK
jgi:hypothetical protein